MNHFKFLLAFFGLILASVSFAAFDDHRFPFDDEGLKERYEALTYELRCPKCQNQNVADSDAPIASDIRERVYDLLNEGATDKEIIDHMIDRYTEFVTYKPQMSFGIMWLYIIPTAVLVIGLAFIYLRSRKTKEAAAPEQIDEKEQQKLNELLK